MDRDYYPSSLGCFRDGDRTLLSHALAGQFDAVCSVYEPIQNGIGDGRIADHVVPVFDGHLAGDDG